VCPAGFSYSPLPSNPASDRARNHRQSFLGSLTYVKSTRLLPGSSMPSFELTVALAIFNQFPMMTKFDFETVLAACLALACLAFTPIAQSKNPQVVSQNAGGSMESRSFFAIGMENQLRKQGDDARVQLDGDRRDVLLVRWAGVHRNDIFAFVSSHQATEARQLGFTRILVTDGRQRWDYDVTRESMVWSPAQ
jgi:hypothetical protein